MEEFAGCIWVNSKFIGKGEEGCQLDIYPMKKVQCWFCMKCIVWLFCLMFSVSRQLILHCKVLQ